MRQRGATYPQRFPPGPHRRLALPVLGAFAASAVAIGSAPGATAAAAADPAPGAGAGTAAPHPGPAILYAPPPRAPQLENAPGSPWHASAILVSGASAYRGGELLYQDYLFDDRGAGSTYTYPSDSRYAGDAADLVEFRVAPWHNGLAVRVLPRLRPDRSTARSDPGHRGHQRQSDLTNISDVTIDTARAHVDCGARLEVTSDGPATIRLSGCRRTVSVPGAGSLPAS